MKKWVAIVFAGVLVTSCLDDPECLRTADTALVIGFKKLVDGSADTVALYTIIAEGADSIFYKNDPEKLDTLNGKALLAVNPFSMETLFTFNFETDEKFLRVGYQSNTRFISEDCGSEQMLFDLTVLETDFDSVRVVNNRLTTSRVINIEIFH